MEEHHRVALETIVEAAERDDTCIGCILGGSVARGWDRPDSDVDVVYVVTDDEFEHRRREWDLQFYREVDTEIEPHGTVPVDGKVVDRGFLEEVEGRGSEPARAAFVESQVRYARDDELERLVEAIPRYPDAHRAERMRTFYSQMQAYRWYVHQAERLDDPYLRRHTVAQLALFGGRLLLAYNRVLFPYHKWFMQELEGVSAKPDGTMRLLEELLDRETGAAADAFVSAIESFADWDEPEGGWPVRFLLDREWQWREGAPALEEL